MKMIKKSLGTTAIAMLVFFTFSSASVSASDWPTYRGDSTRSGVTGESLDFPLGAAWERSMKVPREAWEDGGRSFNVFEFDLVHMPVVADGIVYVANNADDTVYALDSEDGERIWSFTAGAPVRFAPHIAHGRCYFSADDGMVYSLEASSGELVWQKQIALEDRMFVGNSRIISRQPSRSGVVVVGETVYTVAGMWPTEGVSVYALDAETGEKKWINDTSNALYLPYPHNGLSLGGPTSQGYLATDGRHLLMPTGEGPPAHYDVQTGELKWWDARQAGSSFVMLMDGFAVTPGRGFQPSNTPFVRGEVHTPVVLGEVDVFEGDGLNFINLEGEGRGKWGEYDDLPGSPREGKGGWRSQVNPIGGRRRAIYTGERFFAFGMGKLEAIDSSGDELERLWMRDHERVYSMAVADDVLIMGCEGFVCAVDPDDGDEIWRGSVDGQARGLAIAGGRLYVSTNKGALYAFAPGLEEVEAERRAKVVSRSPSGFALILGEDDTSLAEDLVSDRDLQAVVLLSDAKAVQQARSRLVDEGIYGSDIVVHEKPSNGRLPYSDYFAGKVIVSQGGWDVAPTEAYRVLRPYTGVMRFEGMDEGEIRTYISEAQVPGEEIEGLVVRRGALEGAFDWDSENVVDQRVSWPLEMLWFGGPGRQRTTARHARLPGGPGLERPAPVVAAGITYKIDQIYVTAVDSYTGVELWSFYTPGYSHVSADDRYAYIAPAFGPGSCVMQVEARTGELVRIYGDPDLPVYSLEDNPEFSVQDGEGEWGGTVRIGRSETGVEIDLKTQNPVPDHRDAWVFWFDFRPETERMKPMGDGKFPIIVDINRNKLRRFDGFRKKSIPAVELEETEEGHRLTIPFEEIRKLAGFDADTSDLPGGPLPSVSLDISAEIKLWAKDFPGNANLFSQAPITDRNDPWRSGTATFVMKGESRSAASPLARVERAGHDDLPPVARNWGQMPYAGGGIAGGAMAPEGSEHLLERECPITGEVGELFYSRGYGCSPVVASATMNFFRSGTVGLYDLVDDSGMRNLAGTRPGCRITISPAHGVLVSFEGSGDCFCPYNFATTAAMAPARERSNEDWAVFLDQERVGRMRQLGINFGAPGDRRDDAGLLWLGFPRDRMMYATGGSFGSRPQTISLPLALDTIDEGGPYRVNANRVGIEDTDRPWIAASGVEGIRSLELSLTHYDPMYTVLSVPVTEPPQIDGRIGQTWAGNPGVPVKDNPGALRHEGRVRVCHDEDNLYLSFTRRARVDRRGEPQPWSEDAQFSVSLEDGESSASIRLRVVKDGSMHSEAVDDEEERHEISTQEWESGVSVTDEKFSAEMAVPLSMLEEFGMSMDDLLARFAGGDFVRIRSAEASEEPEPYVLSLHFAEIEDVAAGERVFDIKINGEAVAEGVDVAAETGGSRRALIREFSISADRDLKVEFVPRSGTEPILSGLGLVSEAAMQ